MTKKIRPAKETDVTAYLQRLFLKTEQELIREIMRKRSAGYVDYAEAAALERVQKILQDMVDESWEYIPEMIETIFYHSDKDAAGYANARTLTVAQTDVVQQLSNNLLGEIMEMAGTARKSVEAVFTIARLENDPFRRLTLEQVLRQEAAGSPWIRSSRDLVKKMERDGITAFVDKSGRRWSLRAYGNMAVRTTARQAEVAALLTADDHDLWQIIKIGSTCPVCAPLEGRVVIDGLREGGSGGRGQPGKHLAEYPPKLPPYADEVHYGRKDRKTDPEGPGFLGSGEESGHKRPSE